MGVCKNNRITFFSVRDSSSSVYEHICNVRIFRLDFRVSVLHLGSKFACQNFVTQGCHGFLGCPPVEGVVMEADRL